MIIGLIAVFAVASAPGPGTVRLLRADAQSVSLIEWAGRELSERVILKSAAPGIIDCAIESPDGAKLLAISHEHHSTPLIVIDKGTAIEIRRIAPEADGSISWAIWRSPSSIEYIAERISEDGASVISALRRASLDNSMDELLARITPDSAPEEVVAYKEATVRAAESFKSLGLEPPPLTSSFKSTYFGMSRSGGWGAVDAKRAIAVGRVYSSASGRYAVVVNGKLLGLIDLPVANVDRVVIQGEYILFVHAPHPGSVSIYDLKTLALRDRVKAGAVVERSETF